MDNGQFPQWKGLFDWSMKYVDGTRASNMEVEFTPERQAWLKEALTHYMQDFACRMKEIKDVLDEGEGSSAAQAPASDAGDTAEGQRDQGPASTLEQKEALLDELMDLVESIDFARDLHKIGGLPTLMQLLSSPHPSLRWRAAEVAATCMQNNEPVQQWFLDGGLLPKLLTLLDDPDTTVRTKALLAVSCLIKNFPPGMEAFRKEGGVASVAARVAAGNSIDALAKEQRKAMILLSHVLRIDGSERPSDAKELCECSLPTSDNTPSNNGILPTLLSVLQNLDSTDIQASDLRQAALELLLEISRSCSHCWNVVRRHTDIQEMVQASLKRHDSLSGEDKEAEEDEARLGKELLSLLQAPAPPAVTDPVPEAQAPVPTPTLCLPAP